MSATLYLLTASSSDNILLCDSSSSSSLYLFISSSSSSFLHLLIYLSTSHPHGLSLCRRNLPTHFMSPTLQVVSPPVWCYRRYRSINTESNAFKSKLAPLVGPVVILKALGFQKNEEEGKFVLEGWEKEKEEELLICNTFTYLSYVSAIAIIFMKTKRLIYFTLSNLAFINFNIFMMSSRFRLSFLAIFFVHFLFVPSFLLFFIYLENVPYSLQRSPN